MSRTTVPLVQSLVTAFGLLCRDGHQLKNLRAVLKAGSVSSSFWNANEATCTGTRNHISSPCDLLGRLASHSLIRTRTPHIPSTIGDEEYELYSDWAVLHFSKNPPQGKLYLLSRTFKFNPFEQPSGCSHTMIEKANVPGSLTRQLG